ncbi:hypothetical protein ANCDUO_24124 [Ancylostoma duodenale]|uniref:Uncharacterized protein n=1 Tax=Ancylostoma duodenale TaxID=51022 RepID=A0A0C2FBA4_9BILA|nr:hypothetical protein ANCDUO_24124 [Ancylostoma duodenale]
MKKARKIRHYVIGLTETRSQRQLGTTSHIGEELFLGTCDSKGVGEVGAMANTNLIINITSFEELTTWIGR